MLATERTRHQACVLLVALAPMVAGVAFAGRVSGQAGEEVTDGILRALDASESDFVEAESFIEHLEEWMEADSEELVATIAARARVARLVDLTAGRTFLPDGVRVFTLRSAERLGGEMIATVSEILDRRVENRQRTRTDVFREVVWWRITLRRSDERWMVVEKQVIGGT